MSCFVQRSESKTEKRGERDEEAIWVSAVLFLSLLAQLVHYHELL